MKKLIISCKKATELIEKKQLGTISWIERLQLKIHKGACYVCKVYEQQSRLVGRWLSHSKNNIPKDDNQSLKDRILKELNSLN